MANNTQLYRLQVQLKRIAAHREANAEAEVKAIYNSVLQELQNKIASYYAAYGDNDGILTGGELRKIGEYKNFLEDVLSGLDDLGEPVQQQIRQTIEQTYTTCYDGMVAAVQQSVQKNSDLSEMLSGLEGTTPEAVRQVVENPMTNLTLSAVLNRQRSQVTTSIKKTLTTGLASGDSYTKMAQRIAKTLNGNYTKAQRIVRTECNRAIHKGFQDVTDQAADLLDDTDWVEVKTWLSKSDERVRETHAYLDGQMVHAQGEFTSRSGAKAKYPGGFGIAAEDINCRCTVKYTLMKKDEFLAQGGVLPESELSSEEAYKITKKNTQNAYSVNREVVNSKAYHDKFEGLTEHKAANESLYQQAKRLLEDRDGTDSERLILIDSKTGELILDNFSYATNSALKTGITEEQYRLANSREGGFIILHNHPGSTRPSGTDILTLWKETKAKASVVVGHDGAVYCISDVNREKGLDKTYENAYNEYKGIGLDTETAKRKATDTLYESAAFRYQKTE